MIEVDKQAKPSTSRNAAQQTDRKIDILQPGDRFGKLLWLEQDMILRLSQRATRNLHRLLNLEAALSLRQINLSQRGELLGRFFSDVWLTLLGGSCNICFSIDIYYHMLETPSHLLPEKEFPSAIGSQTAQVVARAGTTILKTALPEKKYFILIRKYVVN